MKAATVIGVILIVVGIVALAWQGITYTKTERVMDIGPLRVETQENKTFTLPPALGAVVLAGGVVLVAVGARRKS